VKRLVVLAITLVVVVLVLWADASMPLLSCAVWYDGCNQCGRSSLLSGHICTARACPAHKPTYVCLRRFFQSSR
jgi:hypothetical protein